MTGFSTAQSGLERVDAKSPRALSARLRGREHLGGEAWLLTAFVPGIALDLAPGEFLQAHAFTGLDPLLRRPLAPFDVRVEEGGTAIDLMVAAVGRGTRILCALREGDELSLLGPLGRGFRRLPAGAHVVAVAGGVGLAPLHHLARVLAADEVAEPRRTRLTLILGAREGTRLFGHEKAEAIFPEVRYATDNGDLGFAGNAVEALAFHLQTAPAGAQRPGMLYGCGPEPMLHALARFARERVLSCEVSLERRMACGFGVCFTCVCPLLDAAGAIKNVRTCLDGPVVDADRLVLA